MSRPIRSLYFNRQGEAIDNDGWSRLLGDDEYRRVMYDEVGSVRISTIWVGLDHDYGITGTPLIFETLVYNSPLDRAEWRWPTETDARIGHHDIVRQVEHALRVPHGSQEERIMPDDDRPIADVEPGSVDITALDKAELLAALVNATSAGRFTRLAEPMTHERAAAIIQERLSGDVVELGRRGPFDFDYVASRPIKCDITGPRISAFHVLRYDRDAGAGTMARVVGELRAAYERRRAEREQGQES